MGHTPPHPRKNKNGMEKYFVVSALCDRPMKRPIPPFFAADDVGVFPVALNAVRQSATSPDIPRDSASIPLRMSKEKPGQLWSLQSEPQ
jgi:hypothetical protein